MLNILYINIRFNTTRPEILIYYVNIGKIKKGNLLMLKIQKEEKHACICKHWKSKEKESIDAKNIEGRETYLERNAHLR